MFSNSARGGNMPQGIEGQELGDLQTNSLTFQAAEITAGARLQIFPTPWPQDKQPPPYASLISIASHKGLLAAAGPSSLLVTSTEQLRAQYISRRKQKDPARGISEDENKIRPLQAGVTLSVPRISHVAFNSDESCLVIAAEEGGGLAVYDTQAITNGARDPAFQLGTNGTSIRHLVPNPSTDPSLAYYFGVVLTNGHFLLADLKARKLVARVDGNVVFYENVVSAAWSKLGKQVVAGLEDGNAVQIDREGVIKAQIPRPPSYNSIRQDYPKANALPLASISWLSNFEFLFVYTPFNPPPNSDATDSVYFLVQGGKEQPFTYRRLATDPCMAFVNERGASNHYICRLNDWKPNLADALILASSTSCDISLMAYFKQIGEYRTLSFDNENDKATLPMSIHDESADTTPVGVALDLSVIEVAPEPIPAESGEIRDSRYPTPALCVLGTDGALSIWWVIYDDSIRQGTPYHAMTQKNGPYRTYESYSQEAAQSGSSLGAPRPSFLSAPSQAPQTQSTSTTTSLFSSTGSGNAPPTPQQQQPAFGKSSFATPNTPAFGKPAFGAPSTPSAFGTSSALGHTQSAWGTPGAGSLSSVQKPAFGSGTRFGGPAFGQAGGPNSTASPWGSSSQQSPSAAQAQPSPSGFAKFGAADQPSGFASYGGGNAPSPFAANAQQQNQSNAFGSGTAFSGKSSSPFAAAAATLQGRPQPAFGQPSAPLTQQKPNLFAQQTPTLSKDTTMGSTATLGSTGSGFSFVQPSGQSSFNSQESSTREEAMEDDTAPATQATPSSGSKASGVFGMPSGGFKLGSTFKGDGSAKDDLPRPENPGTGIFGNAFGNALNSSDEAPEPFIKQEPDTESEVPFDQLPPAEPQHSKESTLTPDPSVSQPRAEQEDAPLPPDFSKAKAPHNHSDGLLKSGSVKEETPAVPEDAPLPPDFSKFKASTAPARSTAPADAHASVLPEIPDDAPLPPDFTMPKPSPREREKLEVGTIAGSPPVDLGHETFPSLELRTSAATEAEWEDYPDEDSEAEEDVDKDGEEEGEEGERNEEDEEDEEDKEEEDESEEDGNDEGEPEKAYKVSDTAGLEAFKKRTTMKRPTSPEQSRTPQTANVSYTPAGLPRTLPKGPHFAPLPNRPVLIPRSPSPVRSVTAPVLPTANVHKEHVHRQIKASKVPPSRPIERTQMALRKEKPKISEKLRLEDEEDQRIRNILATPAEPIRELQSFLTHQEYADLKQEAGVSTQIQRVFRDVETMIDVAGLNARHIDAFVRGQDELREAGSRDREALENAKSWLLSDQGNLTTTVGDLEKQLDDGKLDNVPRILADVREHLHSLDRLRMQTAELRRQILARTDPKQRARLDFAPLNAETQAQQADLRHGVASVLKLLADAEERLSLLRADLASANAHSAHGAADASGTGSTPTIESVVNTIMKMTAMVEQRSGDIDLLEAQIRRLPRGLASLRLSTPGGEGGNDYEDALVARMRSSRFSLHARHSSGGGSSPSAYKTPPPGSRRARVANGATVGLTPMFGLGDSGARFRTPPSTSVLARSGGAGVDGFFTPDEVRGSGSAARREPRDVTREEINEWERKRERRRAVLEGFKARVLQRGHNVIGVGHL